MTDEIHQYDLGHEVSDRVEAISTLLEDMQDLDIVSDHAADEHIEEARDSLSAAKADIEEAENSTESFEDTPRLAPEGSLAWAIERLHDWSGQTAIGAEDAHQVASAFYHYISEYDDLTLADDCEYDMLDLRTGEGILDISDTAGEYRGMVRAHAYEHVVTVADLSGHLLEIVGEEPGEGGYIGAGFNADDAHRQNMAKFPEVFDYTEEDRAEWNKDFEADNGDEEATA